MYTNNGQSAAKPLNFKTKQEEGSETISQESRKFNISETGETLKFPYKFYALLDPRTNLISYIGKTRQTLQKRLKQHIAESKMNTKDKNGTKKENWIIKLSKIQLKPTIIEISNCFCSVKEADIIEKDLILKNKSLNQNLLNDDDHGIGLVFGNNKSKFVYQYDLNGQFIKEWFNANVISTELGFSDADIGRCCRNENEEGQQSAYNYYWSFNKYDKYPISEKIKTTKKVYKFDKNLNLIEVYDSVKLAYQQTTLTYKSFCEYCAKVKLLGEYYFSYNELCLESKDTKNKIVMCYNLLGEFIKEYNSAAEAAREVGLKNSSSITQCCKGKQKSAKNFIWKYKS